MRYLLIACFLAVYTTTVAINPSREYSRTPEIFGIKYDEYKIKTPDKYEINVWEYSVLDNVTPLQTMILVGPDAGNMGYLIWQAKALRDKGIRVIAFDYRGFGKSSDFPIKKENLYHSEFAMDLDSVIKHTRTKYPKEKIGLLALSMGTYISLIRKEKIDFLVAEGFYQNPRTVVERIKAYKNKDVLVPAECKEVKFLRPNVPILIFCTSDDKTTITEDAKRFQTKNKVTLIELKGEHLAGFNILTTDSPGDKYAEAIHQFLIKNQL